MYREEQSGGSFMMGVVAGAFVGAGLALLFAPKAGNEIRAQIGEQYRGLAERVGEQTQHLRETAGQWRSQGQERLQQVSSQLSDRMSSSSPGQGTVDSDTGRFPSSAPTV
jgi:gas vesicle protein